MQEWNNVHVSGSGGCTSMAPHGDSIVTGGQEGKINVLTPSSRSPIKVGQIIMATIYIYTVLS